jgi:folate-binding protein YgfZ
VLAKAGLAGPLPDATELKSLRVADTDLLATRMAGEHFESYELWMKPAEAAGVWTTLVGGGAVPVGMEALEMFRIAAGIPRYGVDIRERDLPQETGQWQALNFAKGCYIGQEIVERIRSRGAVHRTFTGFTTAGPELQPGDKLQSAGKEVGEITSVRAVPLLNAAGESQTLALGYVRREASPPGTVLNAGETQATVSGLPFAQIFNSELTHGK